MNIQMSGIRMIPHFVERLDFRSKFKLAFFRFVTQAAVRVSIVGLEPCPKVTRGVKLQQVRDRTRTNPTRDVTLQVAMAIVRVSNQDQV